MQYILTEEEYNQLKNSRKVELDICRNIVNCLCKRVADNEPVTYIGTAKPTVQPWGCIHTNKINTWGYCDQCPVQDVCTLPKEFSK